MEKLTKVHLRKFMGYGRNSSFSIDELQGLLLQIAFAIMMVFMIAYFMFQSKTTREQDEQVLELQKQKLVVAIEKVQTGYSIRYGLNTLLTVGEDGSVDYDGRAYIENGRLTTAPLLRRAFANGAVNALTDYADLLALRRDWWDQILVEAKLSEQDLLHENRVWLGGRIDSGLSDLLRDVKAVQQLSASLLHRHWIRHPEMIVDPAVVNLLTAFKQADESKRLLLTTELAQALRRYAFRYLSREAGVDMLAE